MPDVAEFLERFYTFRFKKQPVGRARYALLTNEAGIVIDDGVACRLSEFHYYITATTGGADRVYQSMLKWNSQWRLDLDISNVTSAYCGINIAGPNARHVLTKLQSDIDFSSDAFPYMGVRTGVISNIPARVIRVGFVGEIGYEIHVPQLVGEALWDLVIEAGHEFGIQPFGIEAQRILRLEKGHIIIGQDTDGYVFVEMSLESDGRIPQDVFFLIKETTGVGDFVGTAGRPTPMARDVSTEATGATEVAPKFSDALTLSPPGRGRFCPPSQRSQVTFFHGYVPANHIHI